MIRLERELSRFEKKFGVKSAEFYHAISSGELEEFDALDEYRMDETDFVIRSILKADVILLERPQEALEPGM